MLTILSALIGLIGSSVPSVLEHFGKNQNNKKEIELAKILGTTGEKDTGKILQAIRNIPQPVITTTVAPTSTFSEKARSIVRPVIALSFVLAFIAYKAFLVYNLTVTHQWEVSDFGIYVFGQEEQSILALILAYYFGDRTMTKIRDKVGQ